MVVSSVIPVYTFRKKRERDQNSVSPRITPLLNGSLTQLEDVEEGSISGDCEDDCMKK